MTTFKRKLTRRSFLRGAGQMALATPLFASSVGRAQGQAPQFPKRVVVFYTPNGKVMNEWGAQGNEHNFQLKPSLAPLERHKNDLIILEGIDMLSCQKGPGSGHPIGMAHLLTGVAAQGLAAFFQTARTPHGLRWRNYLTAHRQSYCHHTPFKSLEFGVISGQVNRLNYSAPGLPIPPVDPYVRTLIWSGWLDNGELNQYQQKRRSIIDFVLGDYNCVSARQGGKTTEIRRHIAHYAALRIRCMGKPAALVPRCDHP